MSRRGTADDDHDDNDEFLAKAVGAAAGVAFAAFGMYKFFNRSPSESSSTTDIAAAHARAPPPYQLESSSSTTNMAARARAPPLYQLESSSNTTKVVEYWKKPEEGWLKINTDASVKYNPSSVAIGGVIRDEDGDYLQGFTGKIDHPGCTIPQAELWAIKEGLLLAWKNQSENIVVETDSEAAIWLLEEAIVSKCSDIERQLIMECRNLRNRNSWTVHLQHCGREANSAADYMAELGHRSGDFRIAYHYEPPNRADFYLNRDLDRAREAERTLRPKGRGVFDCHTKVSL